MSAGAPSCATTQRDREKAASAYDRTSKDHINIRITRSCSKAQYNGDTRHDAFQYPYVYVVYMSRSGLIDVQRTPKRLEHGHKMKYALLSFSLNFWVEDGHVSIFWLLQ